MKKMIIFFTMLAVCYASPGLNANEGINILDEKTTVNLWQNKDALFVNALPAEMYEQEHIPGSVNIPANNPVTYFNKLGDVDKNRKVITYCANEKCKASTTIAMFLKSKGFTDVNEYKGGMKGWKAGNYPVEP